MQVPAGTAEGAATGVRRGCERSPLDPPVNPAVEPITYRDYTKKERATLRRTLKKDDPFNVKDVPFEQGEYVFCEFEADDKDDRGYKLPLSVGKVKSVLDKGKRAKIVYMWGDAWDGKFHEAAFDSSDGRGKTLWTDTITKEAVVMMRGRMTKANSLSVKTRDFLKKHIASAQYDKFCKPQPSKGPAKALGSKGKGLLQTPSSESESSGSGSESGSDSGSDSRYTSDSEKERGTSTRASRRVAQQKRMCISEERNKQKYK